MTETYEQVQRACDELNVEASVWLERHSSQNPNVRTVARLLAEIDELKARIVPKPTEPLMLTPESLEEASQKVFCFSWDQAEAVYRPESFGHRSIIELAHAYDIIHSRAPVDPDFALADELLAQEYEAAKCPDMAKRVRAGERKVGIEWKSTFAALKRGRELGNG
jgi:hypothetical protein